MVSINYATREVSCKIVYYGPGLSGKTTNLQYVHSKVPSNTKGKLISLATDADRTLYFDFLPINIGTINGFAAKFQLYTVPGQVYYNATRKLVLRGVDGVVFVADSQPDKMDENIESLNNLKENLAEYGYKFDEMPIVIQYNKMDLPGVMSEDELRKVLNPSSRPDFKASATEGFGVFDTLKCILKLVLDKAKTGGTASKAAPAVAEKAPAEAAPAEASVQPAAAEPAADAVSSSTPVQPGEAAPLPQQPIAASATGVSVQDRPATEFPSGGGGQDLPPLQSAQPETPVSRETVIPEPDSGAEAPSQYRPFPGNTAADENRMQFDRPSEKPAGVGGVSSSQPGSVSSGMPPIGSPNNTSTPESTDTPRMAPSLKADKSRKKKRSFFKRLFGLK